MSVDTDITGVEKERATLGVDIELTGALVARAGARQGRATSAPVSSMSTPSVARSFSTPVMSVSTLID